MSKGEALYRGIQVQIIDTLIFANKIEYLIILESSPIWVKDFELSNIKYYVGA
jgi:hypothetical protein